MFMLRRVQLSRTTHSIVYLTEMVTPVPTSPASIGVAADASAITRIAMTGCGIGLIAWKLSDTSIRRTVE